MTENRGSEEEYQVRPLRLDRHSLPGKTILEWWLFDTLDPATEKACEALLSPSALAQWLWSVLEGRAKCTTCDCRVELNRSMQQDCRGIVVIPAEDGHFVQGVCAGCVTRYGGMEETQRMVGERILSDLGCDGYRITQAQLDAQAKRARRQEKRRK